MEEKNNEHTEYRNWMGKFLIDLMKAVNRQQKITVFADDPERCFTEVVLSYECIPLMLRLVFQEHEPVTFALWEGSVRPVSAWSYCLDSVFEGQKIMLEFERK